MTNIAAAASGDTLVGPQGYCTLTGALDYAAGSANAMNFYSGKGELQEALSYPDLREQSMTLARHLLASGLKAGDRVGVVAETDGDFARAFFACQYAALVPAPLPLPAALGGRSQYVEHVHGMLASIGATALLAPATLIDWLEEPCSDLPLRFCGTLAQLRTLPAGSDDLPEVDANALAYLQFSSGSTRFPQGVAVTHRAVIANIGAIARYGLEIGPDDRCVSWLPFYHDMGLVGFLLTPLCCAIPVDFIATREFARRPLTWLQLISRNRGTLSYSPSFGYELCARRAENGAPDGLDLSSWRAAGIGGDMVRPAPLHAFAERFAGSGFRADAFVPSYGMAEAALALSFSPAGRALRVDVLDIDALERNDRAEPAAADATRSRSFVFCGPILPGHAVEVRGENGEALAERQIGRILVRGPSLMKEYFARPDETERVMLAGGWLDTGDLGYLADGEIVITGRAKDLIIVNGRNILPQDLEWTAEGEVAALRSGDVAAFSVNDEAGERVVVLFECRSNDPDLRDAIGAEVAGVLRTRHGVHADVVPVPPRALPQTSSGKLSRAKARQLYLKGAFESVRAA
ncbi:fatty acyl-AMP ligase [Solimonas terrae]|uniref:Fatty acyl-AMP ligase n=1 Tax=Solimonas terrae TaxID=1396819 RepID=A0A6M2BMW5_9GAMM|nr:fatty acyl-AMP ligase [Solimonas terrae]NGY03630.1 fatty acyl-AMP ligase [Solimonas terrae]